MSIRSLFSRIFGSKINEPEPIGIQWLKRRSQCPDCKGKLFNRGPRGGMSMNIRCAQCGSKFCFTGPFTQESDRINNSDEFYQIGYAGSLYEITGYLPSSYY